MSLQRSVSRNRSRGGILGPVLVLLTLLAPAIGRPQAAPTAYQVEIIVFSTGGGAAQREDAGGQGVRAAGGNRLQIIRYGVLPQVLPMMVSNTLYMFEHNTRSASILGIVGAGGIGFLLADRLRAYELQEACLIIIMVVLTVYAIDFLSKKLRERIIGDGHRPQVADDLPQFAEPKAK